MGPKKEGFVYEFEGPYLGPIGVILGLPAVCYLLVFACNSSGCLNLQTLEVPGFPAGMSFVTWEGIVVSVGWFGLMVVLHLILPGQRVQGVKIAYKDDKGASRDKQLTYKLNGALCMAVVYLGAVYLGFVANVLNLGWMYDNYMPLLTGSMIMSVSLSFYLFISSFNKNAVLAPGGDSGVAVYDFYMGRELNPRLGAKFDLKEFCELYPGLVGWVMLNLGCAHKQYTLTGEVGVPMLLVNAFHLLYVADAMLNEKSILTTMDITSDGFGYMLAFGDLTWVPFIYSLQARVLVDHTPELPVWYLLAIVALKVLGYAIFRGSNGQKDQFRRDPDHPSVAHLKTLKTESGRQLIISGWWGMARHINYFGDWVMGVAWCLPCGSQPIAYFYAVYFAVLLIHRDMRDGHSCSVKYGKDWDKYKAIVKYHIVPFVY
mmetsp:Transcript_12034/g.20343  ORF Transcript_12034/g.20343 Transcript_12034/m.20343 type:complete len:430 (-) Transcript_12034:329-1618(-)|eukprot:CAMPEP_0198212170 /NCGR_PEP_ID=MMETSP1445-20131203/25560_1 /TAXON_ID=36898 /ORGANISM="Pyramimonas sp., Strain CCMP2087" /LENGTH=429 /DNA_ID=CAMNT_0043886561 /DNA_START=155 /DNA_END=1444 /DNA_ORIENTATION=-